MSLITLQVSNTLLERIAIALERIAGPPSRIPESQAALPHRRIEASDVFIADDAHTSAMAEERTAAARNIAGPLVQPGSDHEREVIKALEEQVLLQYGEEAVRQLPWRKAH